MTRLLPLAILLAAGLLIAEETPPETPAEKRTGKIEIDLEKKTVSVPAKVSIEKGILEFLIVTEGGRDYESVFTTPEKPSDLHAAFLAIGAVPSPVLPPAPADDEKKKGQEEKTSASERPKPPPESMLAIEVAWEHDGKTVRQPASTFLRDRRKKAPAKGLHWIFTGSRFWKTPDGKEHYVADMESSVAAVWYDSGALINLLEEFRNPYRGEFGFEVNEETAPKAGTPVTIIFSRATPPEEEKKED